MKRHDSFALRTPWPRLVCGLVVLLAAVAACGAPAMALEEPDPPEARLRRLLPSLLKRVPEIVVEGETGLLVTPGDEKELAAALLHLTGSEPLRRRMGEAGRARALRLFDVDRTAAQVQELYDEMLGGDRA